MRKLFQTRNGSGVEKFGAGCLVLVVSLGLCARPAYAVNKDLVQIQTQIQELQESVARLQQSNDERMGVLKDLVQQSADSVNKMSVAMEALQRQMRAQQEAAGTKSDQVSGQVQGLNDSIDEIKARFARLDKALADIQNQQQSINAGLQNLVPANPVPVAAPGVTPTIAPAVTPAASTAPATVPPATAAATKPVVLPPPVKASAAVPAAAGPAAPSAADLFNTALKDYMAAKYTLSSSEFGEVIRVYPDNALAGNAYYYTGEIDYRAGKFASAVKDYDHLLEQFPDSTKIPVAHLHKGQALLVLKQNDAGIREFRTLIARFPNSPEAAQARSRLTGLGVGATAKRP